MCDFNLQMYKHKNLSQRGAEASVRRSDANFTGCYEVSEKGATSADLRHVGHAEGSN